MSAVGRAVTGPYTVTIEGVTEPATFKQLCDALAALWKSIRVLPLGWDQASAYERFLVGADAPANVVRLLEERSPRPLEVTFTMDGRTHVVRVVASGH
ncbi:hypothetical protein GCM10009760_17760 [Kitasatospora kazusensis]|uniref:Uncharacterized protein n=1 Tax=Kitasatospora kazusensis TaxID=407974 RepID=A0ABN2Z625_9ACTN